MTMAFAASVECTGCGGWWPTELKLMSWSISVTRASPVAKLTSPLPESEPRRSALGLEVTWAYENLAVPARSVVASTAATHCEGVSGVALLTIPSAAPAAAPRATKERRTHGTRRRIALHCAPKGDSDA